MKTYAGIGHLILSQEMWVRVLLGSPDKGEITMCDLEGKLNKEKVTGYKVVAGRKIKFLEG